MKKSLIKLLSSTIALTLVLASSGAGTAQIDKIKTEDVKADNAVAVVQEVKEEKEEGGIIEALEEKLKEEVPVVEAVKAEPVAAPEVKAEEAAAPEIKVAPAEEAAAPEAVKAEPDVTWNISASESDNVTMAFYAEPTADAGQVAIDRQSGVVEISGNGAMEENVYRHFLSVDKFLTATKAMFEAEYKVQVDLKYDENITDVLELDANIRYYSHETGEELGVTENMKRNLDPAAFVEFSPTEIRVDEGITNVSDYAFICCADVEEVYLPSTVETIGEYAFQYCGKLAKAVVPQNAEIKEGAFSYCHKLEIVQLTENAPNNDGIMAQSEENDAPVNTLTAEEINALVYGK